MGQGEGEWNIFSCSCESLLASELRVLVTRHGLTSHFRDPGLLDLYHLFSHHEPRRRRCKEL